MTPTPSSTPQATPTPTPEAHNAVAAIYQLINQDPAYTRGMCFHDKHDPVTKQTALLIDQHVATRTAQLERERDEAQIQLGAWHKSFGSSQLTHAIARLDAAESSTQQLTTRCAELEGERDGVDAELRRVEWCGGISGAKRLADSHLQLMKELNERDRPLGFDSWEAYHTHIHNQGKELTALRAELAQAMKDKAGLVQDVNNLERAVRDVSALRAEVVALREQIENQAGIIRESCLPANERESRLLTELDALRAEVARLKELLHCANTDREITNRSNSALIEETADLSRLQQEAVDRAALCERLAKALEQCGGQYDSGITWFRADIRDAAIDQYRAATPHPNPIEKPMHIGGWHLCNHGHGIVKNGERCPKCAAAPSTQSK